MKKLSMKLNRLRSNVSRVLSVLLDSKGILLHNAHLNWVKKYNSKTSILISFFLLIIHYIFLPNSTYPLAISCKRKFPTCPKLYMSKSERYLNIMRKGTSGKSVNSTEPIIRIKKNNSDWTYEWLLYDSDIENCQFFLYYCALL